MYPSFKSKNSEKRVLLFHEGALIESDLAYFYSKDNYFKAIGNVIFTQGDSLRMTCSNIEYDGKTQMIILWQMRLTEYETLNISMH